MGNQGSDVKVDKNSVINAISKFGLISDDQSAMAGSLSEVDNELFANWEGEAGSKFELAAVCVEKMLSEIAKKNERYAGALVDLSNQFDVLDQELANGLSVNVASAKGV